MIFRFLNTNIPPRCPNIESTPLACRCATDFMSEGQILGARPIQPRQSGAASLTKARSCA
jgi:hypothetical protein